MVYEDIHFPCRSAGQFMWLCWVNLDKQGLALAEGQFRFASHVFVLGPRMKEQK